jgi:hypothetical protein
MEKIMPVIMIICSVGASLGYLFAGDLKRFLYWLCAGIITYVVTF